MRSFSVSLCLCAFVPLLLTISACSGRGQGGDVKEGASLMTGVRISEVNDNIVRWKMVSTTARFEDGETRIYFDNPKMKFFEDGKPSSDLSAETGFLNMVKKDAELEKNVKVVSKTDGMTLLTSRLFFSSEMNKIWTDDPVTILKGDTVTRGHGFRANPDLSKIEIARQETTTREKK